MKTHTENVHVFEEYETTLEDLGIPQKPEILPRIKQNINIEDLDDDSDCDADFENPIEKNTFSFQTPPPPRETSLSRKCKGKIGNNEEELLQEDTIYLTPRPPTPSEENQTFALIPSPLKRFRKRKNTEPLLSPTNPKKSKKSTKGHNKNMHDFYICKKAFSKKYNVERHIEKSH